MTYSEICVYRFTHNTNTNKTRNVRDLNQSKRDDIYYAMKTESHYTVDSNERDELLSNIVAFAS